jgi:hypothetical protein
VGFWEEEAGSTGFRLGDKDNLDGEEAPSGDESAKKTMNSKVRRLDRNNPHNRLNSPQSAIGAEDKVDIVE